MPCLVRLSAAFAGSHSNVRPIGMRGYRTMPPHGVLLRSVEHLDHLRAASILSPRRSSGASSCSAVDRTSSSSPSSSPGRNSRSCLTTTQPRHIRRSLSGSLPVPACRLCPREPARNPSVSAAVTIPNPVAGGMARRVASRCTRRDMPASTQGGPWARPLRRRLAEAVSPASGREGANAGTSRHREGGHRQHSPVSLQFHATFDHDPQNTGDHLRGSGAGRHRCSASSGASPCSAAPSSLD